MAVDLFGDKKAAGGLTDLITGGAAQAEPSSDADIGGRINVAEDAPRDPRTPPGDAPAGMKLGTVAPQAPVEVAPLPPVPGTEPLDDAYARRAAARESAALDQEAAHVEADSAWEKAQAVGADISKGLVLEGGQAVVSGGKRGVNSMLDLINEGGDYLTNKLGGPGIDTDGNFRWFKPGEWEEMEAAAKAKGLSNAADFFGGNRVETNEKERPKTVTGRMIEGGAQFTTGMLLGGRVLKGWQVAGKGGFILKALAQGGIADFTAFDGNEQRLSNLLKDVAPEQAKPIFEYLAADEDDPELVGRTKNAIEGAGLGLATESLFAGLRQLKAARRAKAAAKAQAVAEGGQVPIDLTREAEKAAAEQTKRDIIEAMGDPAGDLVSETPRTFPQKRAAAAMRIGAQGGVTAQAADEVVDAAINPNTFDINFSRIEAPEDVQAVISTLAGKYSGDVDAARRGIRDWEATRQAAGETDWVASMAARRKGDAANAETVLAYREALNASATKLLDTARAVKENPTVANQYAFRKMMATHHAIQMEFMGARAEAGRALNAFKIPAGTPERNLRQIDAMLADSGGANAARDLAEKVLEAGSRGDVALNEFTRAGAMARSRAMIRLLYTNSLLSSVGTSIVNVGGNTLAIGMNLASRAASPRLARALGDESVTQVGESMALLAGYMNGIKDAFRLSPHAAAQKITEDGGRYLRQEGLFRGMAPGLDEAVPQGISLRAEREEAGAVLGNAMEARPFSAAAWRVDEDTVLGRTLDTLQMVLESPSNANALMDDFFKVVAARGELHAQAFRQTQRELANGVIDQGAVKGRLSELVDNPTEEMLAAAEREMHDLTFTRQTPGVAQSFSKLRSALDARGPVPIGTITLPFLRTPANLISTGIRYSPLAPFMRRYAEDIAEGGARAEIAKAQWAIGTALWSVWLGMAADGQITGNGPGNPAQKQAMMRQDEFGGALWQPYSVQMGDRWYSFERADPIGTSLSLAADMGELLANNDWDDASAEEMTEVSAHAIAAMGQAFFDKTMLRSAMEVTSAMVSGDPTQAEILLKQRAAGAVPGSAALRMFRRGDDEYLRETHNVLTAIRNTIPGLSEDLPIQRDLWGRPRTYQTGLGTVYDAIVPVQTKAAGGTAIDLEILNNGVAVTMPQRTLSIAGENVSLKNRPDIYTEFVRRAGEPAFQHLEAVVTGNHADSEFYFGLSDGPDGGKAEYIRDVIRAYRDQARAEVMDIYASELEAMAAEKRRRREEARAQVQ